MSDFNATLIRGLSKMSSKKSTNMSKENHPLERVNRQLIAENDELQRKLSLASVSVGKGPELETALSEIQVLNNSISSLSEKNLKLEEINTELNNKVEKLEAKIIFFEKDLMEKKAEIQKLAGLLKKKPTDSDFVSSSDTFFQISNVTANARKLLLAIHKCCEGEVDIWVPISGNTLKKKYRIHTSYYTNARLELKELGLIDFKTSKEVGTKREICEYLLKVKI